MVRWDVVGQDANESFGFRTTGQGQCDLTGDPSDAISLRALRATSGASHASLFTPVAGVWYRVQLHDDNGANECRAWIDPVDGMYGGGEIAVAQVTGGGAATANRFTISRGASAGTILHVDNLRLRAVSTGTTH